MALVNLGTQTLEVGGGAKTYSPFAFRDARAYLINAVPTVEFPNNVFSEFLIRAIYSNGTNFSFYTHHLYRYPIGTRGFVFLLPFSNLYDGNGAVEIEAERVPLILGGSDEAGIVTLELTYDDQTSAQTWL